MKQNEIIDKLKKIPLFADICENDGYMNEVSRICTIRKFKKDEKIIVEGDIGSEMFIVYDGAVEIIKRSRAGDDFTVVKLKAEYNVFFGEMALIDDDKRSATVLALEDSVFIVMDKDDFEKLGNRKPEIGLPITRVILKTVASRLRKTNEDLLTLFDALVNEIKN
ncbi:MAG: cyclic nucleotide-binding domain-containing protein [Spirochaetales bacterium]|nr:cyclic nucleotide-binding domain-containing protein [Spirochaetales bacterium]